MPDALSDSAELRRHAETIFASAVTAVDPAALVHARLPEVLPASARHVRIIAAGKAAGPMALSAQQVLQDAAGDSIVVAPHGSFADAISSHRGTQLIAGTRLIGAGHPLPDAGSVAAGRVIIDRLADPSPYDLLLVLLSGGASSLVCAPADGISLDDYRDVTRLLLECGATIAEVNAVRRRIDTLKGGGLARAAGGVPIVALIISDVVDNAPEVIASGPVSADPTSWSDALDVLERFHLTGDVPRPIIQHLRRGAAMSGRDRDADETILRGVQSHILADNRTACRAAAVRAAQLGYETEYHAEPQTGDAAAVGAQIGESLRRAVTRARTDAAPPSVATAFCLVTGGETTVALSGHTYPGGRNQELALAAAIVLDGAESCVLLSAGTDGVDGTTDAAGAVVDGGTASRMRSRGIDPVHALRAHDSHRALRAAGDLLVTGPTGTNVMDIQVALRRNPGPRQT